MTGTDMTSIAPQVDQLFEKMGMCMLPDDEMFNGSSKLVSLLFGYRLIDLALLSLCVTVKSKGLLPDSETLKTDDAESQVQAQLLFEYGLIDAAVYEKILRVLETRPTINLELLNLSSSFPLFDNLLEDVSNILQTTEVLASEICNTDSSAVFA
jgi:hypothetical protein